MNASTLAIGLCVFVLLWGCSSSPPGSETSPDFESILRLHDETNSKDESSVDVGKKTVAFFEATDKPGKAMDKLFKIAPEHGYSTGARFNALYGIAASERIRGDAELGKEFRQRVWEIICKEKKNYSVIGPMDILMIFSDFYMEPPSKDEQESFFELLTDENAAPIARSTAAFCLSNVQEPILKTKITDICQELFPIYQEKYDNKEISDSRVIGRLHIALKTLGIKNVNIR